MACLIYNKPLTHGLLAHSTLVGIPGRLVVMRVGNQPCTNSQNGKGFYLQMGCLSEKNSNVNDYILNNHTILYLNSIAVLELEYVNIYS